MTVEDNAELKATEQSRLVDNDVESINDETKQPSYGSSSSSVPPPLCDVLSLEEDDNHSSSKSSSSSSSAWWDVYMKWLDQRPVLTKSLTAFVILALADLCGQCVELLLGAADDASSHTTTISTTSSSTASTTIDVLRMARFGLLGLLGTPFVHYYYDWLDRTLPPTAAPFTRTTLAKVVIDQFVQAPLVTLAIFVFVGILEGKNGTAIRLQLRRNYLSTMIANWKLFIPAQIINLAFCPPELRVLFLNFVFFFWSIILSVILHGNNPSS